MAAKGRLNSLRSVSQQLRELLRSLLNVHTMRATSDLSIGFYRGWNEVTKFTPTFVFWPEILFNKKLSDSNNNFKKLILKCVLYCLKIWLKSKNFLWNRILAGKTLACSFQSHLKPPLYFNSYVFVLTSSLTKWQKRFPIGVGISRKSMVGFEGL